MSESTPRCRRPAAYLHIPPECRDMIRRGALMAINSSGGKDSQATSRSVSGQNFSSQTKGSPPTDEPRVPPTSTPTM